MKKNYFENVLSVFGQNQEKECENCAWNWAQNKDRLYFLFCITWVKTINYFLNKINSVWQCYQSMGKYRGARNEKWWKNSSFLTFIAHFRHILFFEIVQLFGFPLPEWKTKMIMTRADENKNWQYEEAWKWKARLIVAWRNWNRMVTQRFRADF